MGKRGFKAWQPSPAERTLVEHYVALGYTQEQVAQLMGKTIKALQRHCRRELSLGALVVNAKVGGKLYQKAMNGDTAALIFWAKTRLGWKETRINEHSGVDGAPIPMSFDLSGLTDEQLAQLESIRLALTQSGVDPGGDGAQGAGIRTLPAE